VDELARVIHDHFVFGDDTREHSRLHELELAPTTPYMCVTAHTFYSVVVHST
jgi:hypothetical protein